MLLNLNARVTATAYLVDSDSITSFPLFKASPLAYLQPTCSLFSSLYYNHIWFVITLLYGNHFISNVHVNICWGMCVFTQSILLFTWGISRRVSGWVGESFSLYVSGNVLFV